MEHYFITGVSSGIGLALVKALLNQDQELVIHGCSRRDPAILDPRFCFYALDLSETKQLELSAVDFFKVKPSPGDRIILINNAGMLGNVDFVGHQTAAHYTNVFAVNTLAPILLCEAFVHQFQEADAEKLIFNISSGAASKDIEGWAAYCASKAALDRFTMVCAQEQTHQERPIGLYSISPGVIDTAMQAEIRGVAKERFPALERFVNLHRDGDLMDAQDAAEKILLLLNSSHLRHSTWLTLRDL
jgi:benzil reductase ((S)-benzoin forming)